MRTDGADALLAEILEISDAPSWTDETEIADLPKIDSLKQTNLMVAIEGRLGRKLDIGELLELETVGDLKRLLATVNA